MKVRHATEANGGRRPAQAIPVKVGFKLEEEEVIYFTCSINFYNDNPHRTRKQH